MSFIIIMLVLLNLWALITKASVTIVLVVVGLSIGLFRGTRSEKFRDVFNLHKFSYKLESKENKVEFLGAFLVSFLTYQSDFFLDKFYVLNFVLFIAFGIFMYRFLFFNLSSYFKKTN